MDTPQKESVEILSILGNEEKSWSIDRYHLTVGFSIFSVVVIMGGIVLLASSGGGKFGSEGGPAPTGILDFNQKGEVSGANDYRPIPYPSVRNAMPLVPDKVTASSKSLSKTPTPSTSSGPPTPVPTATPAPTNTPVPEPTATPTLTITPSPTGDITPAP